MMKRPLRIGMTGGIGSGKSAAGECFRSLGVRVLDADEITRELTAPGQPLLTDIRAIFGDAAIDSQGRLARSFLRERIFENDDERRRLEALLHPRVYERLGQDSDSLHEPYVIWIVPLLLETGAADRVDRVLIVDCPVELQIQRAAERDAQPEADIRNIMQYQLSREERLTRADDILANDGDRNALRQQVENLHRHYLALAGGTSLHESSVS